MNLQGKDQECLKLQEDLKKYECLGLDFLVKSGVAYGDKMRNFSTGLFMCSPKAYDFARTELPLPAPSTVRKWLSTIDGSPGFFKEAGCALADLVARDQWTYENCVLMVDGMSIREQIEWDPARQLEIGYVDTGCGPEKSKGKAHEALVFMVVGLVGNWKVPVGYLLIKGVSGEELKTHITNFMEEIHSTRMRVRGIVFDGHLSNVKAAKLLGCRFGEAELDSGNVCSHFDFKGEPVFIFFDVCHALKLLRNLVAERNLVDASGGKVRWEFFLRLHSLQVKEGLHLANRLTRKHVEYKANVMNVSIAAQTLSRSVAKGMEAIRQIDKKFDSEATENFIMKVDSAFDVLNSRSTHLMLMLISGSVPG